jgi:succinate-semialdehyde dehydrogenase / glutarate-semialdehyde dehydrogenase
MKINPDVVEVLPFGEDLGGAEWAVRNPRNGKYDYTFEIKTPDEIKQKCTDLRLDQKHWYASGVEYRISILQKWKASLLKHNDLIISALTHDTGRKSESILEANLMQSSIERWCGISQEFFAENRQKVASIPFISIQQDEVPYSLVGVISPWNFPLLLATIDTIPALLAGCAVIVKPSEVTPRFIEIIQKTIEEVPELAKILTFVAGAGETGGDILQNVDLVCFTGSVATGRKIYHTAAERFIPCFLELGGKDAALVFDGADLDLATSSILWGSVVNCGHSCLSIERVYVQKSIFEEFVNKIVAKAEQVKLAYPTVNDGQIGPVISDKQVKIIDEHLQDAIEKGAKLLVGSSFCENIDGGFWCKPTILTNISADMKVMNEETFGPIIPIMPFENEEQALQFANGTIFGLSGAVFAQTVEEALRIGQKMEAGAISINDCALTAVVHEGEKNSFKMSGIGGTRMGKSAIKRFMRQRAFLIKNQTIRSPWWF